MTAKPCPFCGGQQGSHSSQSLPAVTGTLHFVICVDCGARGPATFDHEEAESLWNQRGGLRHGDMVRVSGREAKIHAGPFISYEVYEYEPGVFYHVRDTEIDDV